MAREDFLVPVADTERCELQLDLPKTLTAPVTAGQEMGKAHAMVDGKSAVASVRLYATDAVEKRDFLGRCCTRLLRFWRLWPKVIKEYL